MTRAGEKDEATPKRFGKAAAAWGIAAPLLLIAGGCSDQPFKMVRVEGTIAYTDGTPIPADRIVITFHPQDPPTMEHVHPRPGQAVSETSDGAFSVVTSHKYDDGIVAGSHKVTVVAQDSKWRPLKGVVPAAYTSVGTTPLSIDSKDSPFELLIERPTP